MVVTVGNCMVKDEDSDNEDGIKVVEITDGDDIRIDDAGNVEGKDDNVNSETITDDEGNTDPSPARVIK